MIKSLFYKVASLLPLSFARHCIGPVPLLPYQHVVSNEILPHISEVYPYKNERQFEDDLEVLLKYGKNHSLHDVLEDYIKTGKTHQGSYILSFDDGFSEVFSTIAPILLKKGVNAIFFINPDFIDNHKLFYRNKISVLLSMIRYADIDKMKAISQALKCSIEFEAIKKKMLAIHSAESTELNSIESILAFNETQYLNDYKPYLTSSQIQQLSAQGFLFGGHSMNHPYYNKISFEEQISQTIDSISWIHSLIQQDMKLFSFPHSDSFAQQAFFNHLKSCKYNPNVLFGTQNMKTENANRVLHRFNSERPQYRFESIVKAMSLYRLAGRILGRSEINRS